MRDRIKVYGAEWCEDTQRTRHQLESMSVPYEYVDVDADSEASEQVKKWNGGRRVTPTVLLPEGNVVTGANRLAAPTNDELSARLRDIALGRD
jgi:thioredoxin reductase (NADPH)